MTKTVPLFFINGQLFQGFVDEKTSGKILLDAVEKSRRIPVQDRISPQDIVDGTKTLTATSSESKMCDANDPEACIVKHDNTVDVPWFGTIDIEKT